VKNVLILGATGMLGSAVVGAFAGFNGQVTVTARPGVKPIVSPEVPVLEFDAEKEDISLLTTQQFDFIINCIGLIKSEIDEKSVKSLNAAVNLNVNLPLKISDLAERTGSKVIQIATDCVYSGSKGSYVESDHHDPLDIYGKTKSLGEVPSQNMMHVRSSIIGKEARGHTSLYDWVRLQQKGAQIRGFTDHFWNGVPATTLGHVYRAVIEKDLFLPGVHHLVPSNVVTKAQLVSAIAEHEGREDLKIEPGPSGNPIDRTLSTNTPEFSSGLWKAVGYAQVPSIEELVVEI
jgi:dTDP-4-dehydrorhamnose reductase